MEGILPTLVFTGMIVAYLYYRSSQRKAPPRRSPEHENDDDSFSISVVSDNDGYETFTDDTIKERKTVATSSMELTLYNNLDVDDAAFKKALDPVISYLGKYAQDKADDGDVEKDKILKIFIKNNVRIKEVDRLVVGISKKLDRLENETKSSSQYLDAGPEQKEAMIEIIQEKILGSEDFTSFDRFWIDPSQIRELSRGARTLDHPIEHDYETIKFFGEIYPNSLFLSEGVVGYSKHHDKEINKLLKKGLIKREITMSTENMLQTLTVKDIRLFATANGLKLKSSLKKDELVTSVANSLPKEDIWNHIKDDFKDSFQLVRMDIIKEVERFKALAEILDLYWDYLLLRADDKRTAFNDGDQSKMPSFIESSIFKNHAVSEDELS